MSDAAVSGDWVEEKIAKRHQSVRLRMMREMHEKHKTQRRKRRDVARVLLAASIVLVGVVMVEMGRKAMAINYVHATEYGRSSG